MKVVWHHLLETNLLDLGICISVQALVTLCSPQADIIQMPRSTGVGNAWSNDLSPYAFQSVHERLRVV